VRGDVHRLKVPPSTKGREQSGRRFAVVLQSDSLLLSTLLVAPTSTSSRPAWFRPEVTIAGAPTRLLLEQTAAVDPSRLGEPEGHLTAEEMGDVDRALQVVMGLD
jgi:mRNA interferase MazF